MDSQTVEIGIHTPIRTPETIQGIFLIGMLIFGDLKPFTYQGGFSYLEV